MSDPRHPTSGVRFLFERLAETATGASYRAAIYTPTAVFETRAELAEDGSVVLACDSGAGAELEAQLAMFGKLTARGAAKRRADGLVAWPVRVLRWRPD